MLDLLFIFGVFTSSFFSLYSVYTKYLAQKSISEIITQTKILNLVLWGIILLTLFAAIIKFFIEAGKILNKEKRIRKKYKYIFDTICETIYKETELIKEDRVSIFILDPFLKSNPRKLLLIGRFSEYKTPGEFNIEFEIGKGACGRAFKSATPLYFELPDYQKYPEKYKQKSKEYFNMSEEEVENLNIKAKSYYAIPISVKKKGIIAVILVDRNTKRIGKKKQQEILTYCDNPLIKEIIDTLYQNLKKEINSDS